MAFKKAKAEQAYLKIGIYGPPGSGKTFTTLLCAEGLAKQTGKRIAFIDTERGTDFYAQAIPTRSIHPEAFDFDALYTRSITDILADIKSLDLKTHGIVVIDSITHVWEAARQAYAGRLNRAGQIPFHAWSQIKKPYKELMAVLLSMPAHVFILGRQGAEFDEDEQTGEMKKVGVKMKAEGETAYEPHILLRMESVRDRQGLQSVTVFAEKDRTGILAGKTFANPTYKDLIVPLLGCLGTSQAIIQTEEETGAKDADVFSAQEAERAAFSTEQVRILTAKFDLAATSEEVEGVGKLITAELKRKMINSDVDSLRDKFHESMKRFSSSTPAKKAN